MKRVMSALAVAVCVLALLVMASSAAWAAYVGPSPPAVTGPRQPPKVPSVLGKRIPQRGVATTGADVAEIAVIGLGAIGIGTIMRHRRSVLR
jgi:hypothetical protein